MKKIKTIYPVILLALLLLVSCKYPIDEENDLSTDEENNLPCYPVGIAFACFLQIEKEYGG